MQNPAEKDATSGGPKDGLPPEDYEQERRNAVAMLADEFETPRSFFVATKHANGTDYIHAHTAETDGDLDGKVYDLFAPLAVHIQEVAEVAEADEETVVECALELVAQLERPNRV